MVRCAHGASSTPRSAQRLAFWRDARVFTANEIARMQEVQFLSELVINLLERKVIDFSAQTIDEYYRRYDEEFDHEAEISERLDRAFDQIIAVDPAIYADSMFSSPQILFSLIMSLDRLGIYLQKSDLISCVSNIDRSIKGYEDLEVLSAEQTNELSGFTGGNLHRIRARTIRDRVISRELQRYGPGTNGPQSLLVAVD